MTKVDHTWQTALNRAYRSLSDLCAAVGVPKPELDTKTINFPLLVPRSYAERMEFGNPNDPLLRQVQINLQELRVDGVGRADPVGEHSLLNADGLIQKYNGRALVITTSSCAVHCRYCFRRHFPYAEHGANLKGVISWIKTHSDIREVILSGGDPLILTDQRLDAWLQELNMIPHVRLIRFHSRIPVVLPERMTDRLAEILTATGKRVVLVIHANHSQELQGECEERLRYFSSRGLLMLNQSVLLAGVNDSFNALSELSWKLMELGVKPYYLHQLDRVAGADHFQVSDEQALEIIGKLRYAMPGHLVPQLVREIAGEPSKSPIF